MVAPPVGPGFLPRNSMDLELTLSNLEGLTVDRVRRTVNYEGWVIFAMKILRFPFFEFSSYFCLKLHLPFNTLWNVSPLDVVSSQPLVDPRRVIYVDPLSLLVADGQVVPTFVESSHEEDPMEEEQEAKEEKEEEEEEDA